MLLWASSVLPLRKEHHYSYDTVVWWNVTRAHNVLKQKEPLLTFRPRDVLYSTLSYITGIT